MKARLNRLQIWGMPAVLGFASVIGLVAALVSDGLGDYLSWSALAMPVAVAAWFGLRRCIAPGFLS